MGLVENLVQGLATAAGADYTAQAIQKQKDRRQGFSDDYRKSQITEHMGTANHMQKALALMLNPDTLQPLPGKEQQVAQLRQQLSQVDARIKQLYDPNFNPQSGMMEESLLHKLGDKLHITQPPDNKTAAQQMQDLAAIRQQYSQEPQTPTAPEENKYLKQRREMKEGGFTDEEIDKKLYGREPKTEGAPGEPKPVKKTADERARDDFAEFQKRYKEKHHTDYPQTFEYWKTFEAAEGRAGVPKAAKPPAPVHLTPAQNAAQKDYLVADKLARIADEVAKAPNDAVNQKRLAVSLERISAGRFTTQALDYIIKAGWGNTIEQWANNPSTGALPTDVMRQLIDGAHQNRDAAKAELDQADEMAPKAPGAKTIKKPTAIDDDDEFLKKIK